jgi:DNA-directed RNA polymerase specialized sigma24 family protein
MAMPAKNDPSLPSAARASMRALGDAALVDAMRRGEENAFQEFIVRFECQLDQHARRLGLAGDERRTIVTETIDDAALSLIVPGRATPRSLRAYLVTSLRNRLRNDHRTSARSRVREISSTYAPDGEVDESLGCSEASLRASAGASAEAQGTSPAVYGLASALMRELTAEERELLGWVSHHVPYREIARWLDVGYATVGKRVERLRARMRTCAALHMSMLDVSESAQLEALLARGAAPDRLDSSVVSTLRTARGKNPREGVPR